MPKPCTTCKHFSYDMWADCNHPRLTKTVKGSIVYGTTDKEVHCPSLCAEVRKSPSQCGEDATWWEPKPPSIFARFCMWAGLPKKEEGQ